MRIIILMICGLYWTPVRAQNPTSFPRDSINMAVISMDTVPEPVVTDTLFRGKPMKLDFQSDRAAETSVLADYLQAGVNYQSNDVYNGRKADRVIPLITPQLSYIFKNGVQTDISVGYDIHDPSPQVNQYTMDVSYNFSPGNGNYSSSLTASRFFYSDQSASTTAEQQGSFELDNNYDFNIMEAGLYLTWTYGDGKDYGSTFSLQHEFDFKNGKLNISPDLSVNAGTQNYYDSYYRHRKYRIGEKNHKPEYEKVLVYGDVLNAGKFQVLDYELTTPVNFMIGKLAVNFTPTYSVPVNPADILVTTSYKGQIISVKKTKEKLENSFYWQLGCTYVF